MANTPYANFFLANEIEDQYTSRLDLQRFCVVRNDLEVNPGLTYTVNTYTGTGDTQVVAKTVGNTATIEAGYTPHNYTIQCIQNRFKYQDEDDLQDPMIFETGARRAAAGIFNKVNDDIYAQLKLGTIPAVTTATPDFGAFVDVASGIATEDLEGLYLFGLVNPADMGKVRKALKDDLKYVEAFSRNGYVGTVAGINLFTKKNADVGTIVIATNTACTVFNKKGVEVERVDRGNRGSDDANTRTNWLFTRKYYVAALTDATKAGKITISTTTNPG